MKTVLLGIDLQYDFCNPKGALYVKGADKDVLRINTFINKHLPSIDHVVLSMDSHQPIHIAHQVYWRSPSGNCPDLFSTITRENVERGEWIAQYNEELTIDYLTKLEQAGDACTIWPPHCIIGTRGWSIDDHVFGAIQNWTLETGYEYQLVNKGMYQSTEHYSLFKAAVEYESVKETLLNTNLIESLKQFDRILIVGEAADFCVANSLNDLVEHAPELCEKIFMLTDCISYIIDKNTEAESIFEKAKSRGVKFCLSTEI